MSHGRCTNGIAGARAHAYDYTRGGHTRDSDPIAGSDTSADRRRGAYPIRAFLSAAVNGVAKSAALGQLPSPQSASSAHAPCHLLRSIAQLLR